MEPIGYWLILILALAALAAVLVRRWQSRQALVRRLGELSTLAEIGRALSSAPLDLPRLAELVCEQAGQIVDTSTFQLGLFEGDRYRLLLWIVAGERRPPAEFRLTPDSLGIMGWVRENRQSLLVRDFERETHSLPAQPRYAAAHPPRSAVFVPLLLGDAALGAIALQSPLPNAFTEEDLRLLHIVANHAAAALQNARLYEQSQRRALQLELVAGVAQRVNVLQPLNQLMRQVVDLMSEALGGLVVSFYETDGDTLRLRATAPNALRLPAPADADPEAEPPELPRALPAVIALGEGLVGEAAQSRQAMSFNELPEMGEAPGGAALRGGRGELAVPVQIDERVLGVLHAYHDGAPLIDDSVQAVFQSLAAQMALAILEAQVYAAEQRRADQFAALAQASRTVASTLELDDMLDEVLDVVDDRFGYKAARIFLLHDDQLVFHAGIGVGTVGQSIEGLAYALNGPGLIARVGRTRELLRVAEVSAHADYVPGPGLATTRAELAAPMVMGARLLGVFDVQSDRAGAFTDEDARTVQALADTLAVAVRNARLFEFERRRRHLAEIMREVSVALTSTLQLDQVLDLILDGLALVVSYDAASILLANEAGQMILRATRGAPGAEEAVGRALAVRRYEPGEAVPSVLPFHEVDLAHEYHDLLALPGKVHACLGAPLAPGGTHAGYLVVDCGSQSRFPQGEIEMIATFASQAAVAIENARLYTAQREQAWISTALLQVADATARTTELDEVLDTVARLTPMLWDPLESTCRHASLSIL